MGSTEARGSDSPAPTFTCFSTPVLCLAPQTLAHLTRVTVRSSSHSGAGCGGPVWGPLVAMDHIEPPLPCCSQSFTRNVPVSRVPGSRPPESHSPASQGAASWPLQHSSCSPPGPGLVLSLPKQLAPGKGPLYLVHTSDNTILPEPSSASPDNSWGLGLLRALPGSPEPTASLGEVARP